MVRLVERERAEDIVLKLNEKFFYYRVGTLDILDGCGVVRGKVWSKCLDDLRFFVPIEARSLESSCLVDQREIEKAGSVLD